MSHGVANRLARGHAHPGSRVASQRNGGTRQGGTAGTSFAIIPHGLVVEVTSRDEGFLEREKTSSHRGLERPALTGTRRLGGYELGSLLGKGGTASVYRARRISDGQRVAIKVIAEHLLQHSKALARFEAEARVLMRIEHPNIVRVLETGRAEDGTLFQVMELLEGRNLAQVMRFTGAFTPWQVLPYLEQICAGLQASHDHGVIHRDLKPQNIFVLDGEPPRVKLLDFGIARRLEAELSEQITAAGVTLGTPLFMAPEQAMGDRDRISPGTDLYSLGVILYVMLSGTAPFRGGQETLILSHVVEPLPPLRERAPEVPPAVAEVVHLCLEKEPLDRPISAEAVLEMFARAVESGTVVDVTPPWFASEPGFVPGVGQGHSLADELHRAPTVLFRRPIEPESTARVQVGAPAVALFVVLGFAAAALLLALLWI